MSNLPKGTQLINSEPESNPTLSEAESFHCTTVSLKPVFMEPPGMLMVPSLTKGISRDIARDPLSEALDHRHPKSKGVGDPVSHPEGKSAVLIAGPRLLEVWREKEKGTHGHADAHG